MPLILVHSDRFVEHVTPPGHPERPERAAVMNAVASRWRERGCEIVAPRAATREQLARVHDTAYIQRIADTSGQAIALDPDTYTSPESYDVALLAAGAAVDAVERAIAAPDTTTLALVRPPGHHAERDRAMGFCLFNNVAVAAAHARALGLARVAIMDYDVHHGNGTEHMFESDPAVLYLSTHQFPYYPGTGAAGEIGVSAGRGFTVNVPLEAGALDEDYRIVFAEVIVPVLRQFKPDLLIVSAGFDAHERDPLAGMRLTTPAFAAMTGELRAVAAECCQGKMAVVTEGGYDLHAFGTSLDLVADTLASPLSPPQWPGAEIRSERGAAAVAATTRALSDIWRF
jgi:acetoin utilization deacetylase AcuC-like enzyme